MRLVGSAFTQCCDVPNVQRRRFLTTTATLSTAALTATVGRQSWPSEVAKPTQLDKLWFVNRADDGCDASVTVTGFKLEGDGFEAVVHEALFRLGPDANVTRDPAVRPFDTYVVDATVGEESLTVDTTDHVNEAYDCIRLKYERWTAGSVELVPTPTATVDRPAARSVQAAASEM